MASSTPSRAGKAYFVPSATGGGPAVMLLHSWWGLTDDVKERCHDLADRGFVVVAPDLQYGEVADDLDDARRILDEMDPNVTAGLIMSTAAAVRTAADDPTAPIAVVGFFSGASWALWLAVRQPDSVRRVVAYYGTQDIDVSDLSASVLGHVGRPDEFVTDDQLDEMHAHLLLAEKDVRIHRYDEATFFAERGPHPHFAPDAAALAWERTVDHLATDLNGYQSSSV